MNFIFSWQKQYFTHSRVHIFAPPCNILYVMLTKRRRQQNSKKKTTLHVQHTVFVLFLHDDNTQTSRNVLVKRFMEEMLYVVPFSFFFFLLPLFFTLASISHFLTVAIKFSCYSSNEIMVSFFISGSSSTPM